MWTLLDLLMILVVDPSRHLDTLFFNNLRNSKEGPSSEAMEISSSSWPCRLALVVCFVKDTGLFFVFALSISFGGVLY
jgi:hypothetical protein